MERVTKIEGREKRTDILQKTCIKSQDKAFDVIQKQLINRKITPEIAQRILDIDAVKGSIQYWDELSEILVDIIKEGGGVNETE